MATVNQDEHEARYRLWSLGKTDPEIAEERGYSKNAIYHWRKVNGLKANAPRGFPNDRIKHLPRLSAEKEKRRYELWKLGLSDKLIAKRLGLKYECVAQWRLSRGLAPNSTRRRRIAA